MNLEVEDAEFVCLFGRRPVPEFAVGTNGFHKIHGFSLKKSAIGDIHKVITAWDYLYRDWLIKSAYEPEHAPALELQLCRPVRKPAEMRIGRNL
jgi:hypothetical protein